MNRYALCLSLTVALVAMGFRSEELAELVPEGEPQEILRGAHWAAMGSVGAVAFSPDGRLLASGGSDGAVRVWDVATGRELRRLEGHTDSVQSVAFSPDGRTLASGGKDNIVRLWGVDTGRELNSLKGHTDFVRSVAFSPDGQTVASGAGDMTVRLWDAGSGLPRMTLAGPADPVLFFSSDDNLQAVGAKGESLQEWNVSTGEELSQGMVEATQEGVAEAPSPPSQATEPQRPPKRWGNKPSLQHSAEQQDPLSVYSPDGALVASGGSDNTIRLREPSGRVLRKFEGHTAPAQALAFSPDGRTLASGGGDNTVRLWDVATGRALRRLEGNLSPVWSVAFSRDGRTLASAGSDTLIHLWDPGTGSELRRLVSHTDPVRAVAISSDGRLLASGGEDGIIYLWEPRTGHQPRRLEGHTGSVYALAFSPDGSLLLSGGGDASLRLWRTSNGQPLNTHSAYRAQQSEKSSLNPKSSVRAVAFSPNGRTVAWGGDAGLGLIEDLPNSSSPLRREVHPGFVRAVAFSPDGRTLAFGGDDKLVRLWDVRTGALISTLKGHSGPVWSVAFSPDGRTLASGGGDKKVLLWKVGTSTPQHTLKGHMGWVTSVAFRPDGQSLASGDDAGVVRLWSLQDPEPSQGLLRGARQGWLSQLPGEPVFRHDDGSFLSHVRQDGTLESVLPPRPELPPRLKAVPQAPLVPPGDFGEMGELVLTVSNASEADRAYWLRVTAAANLPPGLVLLPPAPVPRLEPGSSVQLSVGFSYLRPEGAPPPEDSAIRLKLVDAFGTEFPMEEIFLPLRTPELALVKGPHVKDETLTFTLKNTGSQPTGELSLVGEFGSHGKQHSGPRHKLTDLAPGDEYSIPIQLSPGALKAGRFTFKLTASYEKWPRTWTFVVPEVKVPVPYGVYISLALGALLLFGFVYYARVYRNPMVVHASSSPATLRNYPLAQMVAADHALRRARRLDSTITAAGIPATRWARALCGAREPQDAARAFAEAIGGRLGAHLGSNSWALSLPPLRLRFARDTAVVVIDGTRLESGDAERRMADIFQDGRGPSQVLVLDRTSSQNARRTLEGVPRVRCVVLSDNRLRDLLLADEPVRLLETTISEQVAVSELSPYQVAGGVKLENLFFGREREVRAIADRAMRNFLVVGQRQMGKSSLLLAVLRRLQSRPDLEASYVELADADLHRRLARERDRVPAGGAPLPPLVEVAAGTAARPRVWLIDEADDFISADAKAGYPVLQALRALAEEGRAYFILAGFWDLYRAVVLDEKQPLRNFGEHLRLEPLDPRSALALVTEPMTALGLQWDTPTTPEFLVEQSGRRANLLVLACKALVESLPPDTHVLTREHLERVLREDKDLRDQGRRWRGDHPLHRAVVRQALLLGRPTREEVRQALKARDADIRSADFDEAMDHRELSYVLVPDGEGRLYCPVPLMQRYIESERGLDAGLAEDLEDLRRRGLAEVPKPA